MENEEWRPIPGFPQYEVSNWGRVLSRKKKEPRVLKGTPGTHGYIGVSLHVGPVQWHRKIHVLVALAFLGPRPKGYEVCHNDGDPKNNRLDNLRYGTPSENAQDRIAHGRDAKLRKAHCPQGHPYDYVEKCTGARRCRRCRADVERRKKERRRAAAAA